MENFQFIAKDEENTKSSQAMEELSLFWCLIIIYYQMSHRKVWRNDFLHLFSTMWALAMCWEGMFHWKTRHASAYVKPPLGNAKGEDNINVTITFKKQRSKNKKGVEALSGT